MKIEKLTWASIVLVGLGGFSFPLFAQAPADAALKSWEHESELGVTLSGGNSDTETYHARQQTLHRWSGNALKTTGHFLVGRAQGIESARNWHIDLRYERDLSAAISAFTGAGVESNRFAGVDSRSFVDLGAKYWIIAHDKSSSYVFTELGYRFAHQNNSAGTTPPHEDNHFIRAYLEGKKSLTETVHGKVWVEVLPDLSQSRNLNLNFEPSISVVLSSYFSLKVALSGRYDGLPNPGKKTFDWLYTTSLVATY